MKLTSCIIYKTYMIKIVFRNTSCFWVRATKNTVTTHSDFEKHMDSSHATTPAAVAAGGGGSSMMISQSTDASPVDSSATTAATPIDDPKENLTQVINSIQKTLGTLHQLYLTVSSYNVASQLPLLQRMYNYVLSIIYSIVIYFDVFRVMLIFTES